MQNGVLLQVFHWHDAADGTLWERIRNRAGTWAERGFTALWLPPPTKGAGGADDVGYAVYDLWDLGEFDQKGAVRTRYGTRDALVAAVDAAHEAGLQVYADIVLNHRDGGDETQDFPAVPVASDDRNMLLGEPQTVRAYTRFTFPGRGGAHSTFVWDWTHFAWIGHNLNDPEGDGKVYRIKEPVWGAEIDDEHGIFDFLLGCDIDHGEAAVRDELNRWGEWLLETTRVDGFRLDALKHVRRSFATEWLAHLRASTGRELPAIGEYWSADLEKLSAYIDAVDGALLLFDVPLHDNLHRLSQAGAQGDLRTVFDGSLVARSPLHAVTFVENHDTQPGSALESRVDEWFKPHAYAAILLRQGGYPCVFLADYDGASYALGDDAVQLGPHASTIDTFLMARREYGYGEQRDFFAEPQRIGWVRLGDDAHPGAMAVVLSTAADDGTVSMALDRPGARFYDATGRVAEAVVIGDDGVGGFVCPAGTVTVWLEERRSV
jgi:alpha-amylase